jgi:hypothetical protein
VLKKNLPGLDEMELMHSSLTVIRSMARVKSNIQSFEPKVSQKGNSVEEDSVLLFEDDEEELLSPLTSGRVGNICSVLEEDLSDKLQTTDAVEAGGESTAAPTGLASALKSAMKSGKCKASLRIRWRGPEIFFIEARQRKHFQPMYFDDLLEDRFKEAGGSEHGGSYSSLLQDRFAGGAPRMSDATPSQPSRPPRRSDDWSDFEDSGTEESSFSQDNLLAGKNDPSARQRVSSDDDKPHPADPPAIWITVMESDGEAGGLMWRVKRVWDDAILDSREKERIVPDEDLLNMVKNLSGLPAIPTANLLNNDDVNEKMEKGGDAKDDDSMDLSNWCIKKFYDINGEIVDELQMSERSLDEDSMLNEIVALARESCNRLAARCNPVEMEDKWKANNVDAKHDVPVSEAIQSAMELRRFASVSSGIGADPAADKNPAAFSLSETKAREVPTKPCDSGAKDVEERFPATTAVPNKGEAVPGLKIKKKKKRKPHGTLADLLSPPPVTTFHGETS